MKERLKQLLAVLVIAVIILVGIPPISISAAPTTYSKESNSGTRNEVCTTLDGTSASSYYTSNYAYDNLDDLSSSALFSSLQTLMRSTHSYKSTYNDCHYKADKTDCENNNGKVTLIYTSYQATMSQWNGWNREHVWPESLGGDTHSDRTGGADLHHIRPSDSGVNSSRGNKKYGESGTNPSSKYGTDPAVGVLGGTYNSTYYEPLDNVKGDVARICLYVYVRWNSDWGAESITKVFQSVDVLLEWCELDPVDTWEMGRNEVIQNIQGNRNVFIDYPELAWMLFDREVPSDMTTPSGEAKNGTSSGNTGSGNTGGGNSGTTTPGTVYELTTTLNDGDKVVIGAPAFGKALSVEKIEAGSYYNKGIDYSTTNFNNITDNEIFTVKVNTDGSYTFTSNSGKTIALADEHNSLNDTGANKSWKLEAVSGKTGVYYVKNTVRGNYIEWYDSKGNFSTYSPANSNLFELSFYMVEAAGGTGGITPDPDCTHQDTSLLNIKEATCLKAGYSGDEYCTDCNELIKTGEEIPALGHSYGEETVVEEATETTMGLTVKICERCGNEEYTAIPVLEPDNTTQTVLIVTGSSIGGVSVLVAVFFILKKFVF